MRIDSGGRELVVGSALDGVLSVNDEADDLPLTSGVATGLTISTTESRVRDVCRDDRSEGMPLVPTSPPSLVVSVVKVAGAEAKSVLAVCCAMM